MTFEGFEQPQSNYSKLPHEFIWLLPDFSCHAELCVVIYTLRHTWGFNEFGKLKRITLDEYENGRKRADGTRIDRGCGVKSSAVRRGLLRAVEHSFLIHEQDSSDPGRVENYYGLNIKTEIQGDHIEHPGSRSDHSKSIPGDRLDHSERSNRSPVQRNIPKKDKKDLKDTEKKEVVEAHDELASRTTTPTFQKTFAQRMEGFRNRRTLHVAHGIHQPPQTPPVPTPLLKPADGGERDASALPKHVPDLSQQNKRRDGQVQPAGAVRDIAKHPLWLAFKRRWFELVSVDLTVPIRMEKAYAGCAQRLDEMGVTIDQIERLAEQWITEENFKYPFSWAADRIQPIFSADGAKRAKQGAGQNDDSQAQSLEASEAILADPDSFWGYAMKARTDLELLTKDRPPEAGPAGNYWIERDLDESVEDYLRRRTRVWQDMLASGAVSYTPREKAIWAADRPRPSLQTARVNTIIARHSTGSMSAIKVWDAAFQQLGYQMDRVNFETYARSAQLVDYDPATTTFTLVVASKGASEIMQAKFYRSVRRLLSDMSGLKRVELCFLVEEEWLATR